MMQTLNTMFINKSNTVCNTACLVDAKIALMHIQMVRLYEAAQKLLKVSGQAQVAKLLNQSSQTLNNWEARGMSKGGMLVAQQVIGCSATWLASGEGSMLGPIVEAGPHQAASTAPFDSNVSPVAMGSRAIPVISAIQAGKMKEIAQPYALGDGYASIYVDDGYSPWAFALEIEGDSMTPDYQEGDLVIIEPEWSPRPGECVAARNGRQEATFKKYRQRGIDRDGNDIFELVPLNENYPTVRSDETSLTIIGVMAEHRRKARRR
jgi:SOS-response transcriptional repressor LexA